MKVVLWKPLVRPEYLFDPLWSQYLGFKSMRDYLRTHASHNDVIIAATPDAIVEAQPDLLGISCVSEMWEVVKRVLCELRVRGMTCPIVIGGPHITALPEMLPPQADCAVIGDGEEVLRLLVNAYAQVRHPDLVNIPGIAFRNAAGEIVRTQPLPALSLDTLPVDVTEAPAATFQVSTIRGCPFHCVHCVEHDMQGHVRFMSAERLLWIMKRRLNLTGNPSFFFQDDTFLAARGRLEELHQLMAAENLLGRFRIMSVSLNANLVRESTLPLLKEIGVERLGLGIESLNPRVLAAMKNGIITLDHIETTMRYVETVGLPIGGSQVYGFPGETREEMIDSIERVLDLERRTRFKHWVCYVCQPLPGSILWQQEVTRRKVSLGMDFSTLRIDGDCRFFTSPWYYGNEECVPRAEFLSILRRYNMLAANFFVPPAKVCDFAPPVVTTTFLGRGRRKMRSVLRSCAQCLRLGPLKREK